jgi:diguanylate cyclase (GGDEF)-like protein
MFKSKILRKFLLAIIILVVGYTIAIVFIALPQIDRTIKDLEEQNAKEVLNKVVLLTDNVAQSLEDFQKESLQKHKQALKNITDVVHSMMKDTYNEAKNDPDMLEARKKVLFDRISKVRYGNNNYLFVVDYNATMLSHPYIEKGSDMRHIYDIKGQPIVPRIIDVARKYGEGFTHYWWKKNNGGEEPYEKLTYSRNCPQLKVVVGTGVYIDDIQHEIGKRKRELFDALRMIMKETKIGKTGYIYIFDKERMIIHPNSNIDGLNFRKLPNPGKGTYIYDDLVKAAKGSGVLRYKWDKPTDKGHYVYDKISWIRYVPSMKLYVVSSAYVSELEAVANTLHNRIILLGLLILVLSLLFSTYYLHRLFAPVCSLTKTANEIAKGNYSIRATVATDDEIGVLAKNFNTMVDRLEEQIMNLDQKVKEKTEKLKQLAITDSLTGLYNRRYFSEMALEIFELEKRESDTLSIIMLDIDKFKRVNDTYGHQAGDEVIVQIAVILEHMKRESDIVCRYGGEEFVLLLPKTSGEGAYVVAERIREEVAETIIDFQKEKQISFTVSLGVSEVIYEKDNHIEAVIKRADDALYKAKQSGRNRTCKL